MLKNEESIVSESVNNNKIVLNFVDWLGSISWGKFILFIIFISIGKNILENILGIENSDLLDNVIGLFIFLSFGIKLFEKPKIKINNLS